MMIVVKLDKANAHAKCQCCFSADDIRCLVVGWRDDNNGQTTGITMCAGCRVLLLGVLELEV